MRLVVAGSVMILAQVILVAAGKPLDVLPNRLWFVGGFLMVWAFALDLVDLYRGKL